MATPSSCARASGRSSRCWATKVIEVGKLIERAQADHPGCVIDCYLLFSSNNDAMELFGEARAAGFPARVSPTPRQARACCGVALLVGSADAAPLERLARERGIPLEGMAALPRQIDPYRDRYC